MILEKTFYNIKCDVCGALLDSEVWFDEQTQISCIADLLRENGWVFKRMKHYCQKCHHYGDDNELILADGTTITSEEEDWE